MSTTVTLTAGTSPAANDAPYVDVLVSSIDAGISTVTVWRTIKGRELRVRGMVALSAAGSVTALDFEAAPGFLASYRVQQFDAGGNFVSWSTPVTITPPANSDPRVAWFHNPLDPTTSVKVLMTLGAGSTIARPLDMEILRPKGRSAGVALFGVRQGVTGVPLDCVTLTEADADLFDALWGGYDDLTVIPIICVRLPKQMRVPSPLFALVASPQQMPLDFSHAGTLTQWALTGDEISPPPEAIIVALLDYADFTAFYTDYAAFTAAYVDYQTATRDYSIAGTA
jgi:hypothetical protein